MKDVVDLIGRIFISLIFLWEAYDSIAHFAATKNTMSAFGITWQQDILLSFGIFILLFGGILVLLGYRSGFGAVLLMLYYIPATFILHSWWNEPIDVRRIESILFMKNIAIIGGLLMIYVNGSGKYSVKRLFATTKVRRT